MLPSDRSYLKKKASALRKDVFNRIQERQAKVYTAKSRAPTTTPMVGHSLARSETTRHSKRITCRLGLALNILSSAFTSLSLSISLKVSQESILLLHQHVSCKLTLLLPDVPKLSSSLPPTNHFRSNHRPHRPRIG